MLRLESVSVRFGHAAAVHDLDLEVKEGEIVALLGANGAGKTTTLRAIAGLEPVSSGQMTLNGVRLDAEPTYRRVRLGLAMVPEGRQMFGDQTVEDNLLLGAFHRAFRASAAAIQSDIAAMYERFPVLGQRRAGLAGGLSGGEQQQLAIARALMARPRLLALDEPTLGLAPLLIRAVFELVAQIRSEGTTVLLVEQRAYQALEIADRAYVLQRGACVLSGAAGAVRVAPELQAAYFGE
ncbi:MAG: ABC transporter ATP-binding protein [Chloroflexi bacterium]|nr:ABC transporter ATP-binding protein [Chloroflexota bacterium]